MHILPFLNLQEGDNDCNLLESYVAKLGFKLVTLDLQSLIVVVFNNRSTLIGHFVSSPREREKRDRRDSRRDKREGQVRKRNRNESEETEEIKTFLAQLQANISGHPGDVQCKIHDTFATPTDPRSAVSRATAELWSSGLMISKF